ncbi:DUF3147 family protein [Geobacter pelophilus]|jgi:uncharacterized membrane protein (GlpM family)|uniref:DUF3147 family protein n=1 Tax=Geoanaerobacter pelophilus TaxID=60036 RepID=A0AAW4L5X6_9BACT|nr:DUF3147 family protein [Geoanaerobacter pelophilus]MBT0665205.1 DUF3147 family protein [Geoanaerobacter pelophilus]
MPFVIKLIVTNIVIIGCVQLGKKLPSVAGLVATMPITTLAVLLWLHAEKPSDNGLLTDYTRGVLWGIVPTALFFGSTMIFLKRGLSLNTTLSVSFVVWLSTAALLQWLLKW